MECLFYKTFKSWIKIIIRILAYAAQNVKKQGDDKQWQTVIKYYKAITVSLMIVLNCD